MRTAISPLKRNHAGIQLSEQNCMSKTIETRKCWPGEKVESGGTYLVHKQERTGRMRGRGEEGQAKPEKVEELKSQYKELSPHFSNNGKTVFELASDNV